MVNRENIFNQIIDLFSDDHFHKEYPLYIKFEGKLQSTQEVFSVTCSLHFGKRRMYAFLKEAVY